VTPELPASRPIDCEEEGFTISCGLIEPEGEGTLGVSDLRIGPPPPERTFPGAKVKVPFAFDFASSAAQPPKFNLAVSSSLPNAELGLSNMTFTRAPTDPATNRAPATTRNALVTVPDTARGGRYELALTATADQGGAVTSAGTLVVRPKGRANVKVGRRVRARAAWARGIPVRLTAPIAGTRFLLVLKGPGPGGHGKLRLARRASTAKRLGTEVLRLRIPRSRAEDLRDAGAKLKLAAKVRQPGLKKPRRMSRVFSLR
jgi:hypothetical protein